MTPEELNAKNAHLLPGHLGIRITLIRDSEVRVELGLNQSHMARNGYLHAGTVVTCADTACGHGCMANLPDKAIGFTTIELKSNHLGTVREGVIESVARPVHMGKTTQVWDATVYDKGSGKTIALYRCTQMILYPSVNT